MRSIVRLIALLGMLVVFAPGRAAAAPTVPPLVLAARLHLAGSPVVGKSASGDDRPWYIWAAPDIQHARAILSAGPRGAAGSFDFFLVGSRLWATHAGTRPLVAARARQAALAWLHRVGALALPPVTHVIRGSDGTMIGGTGLCCWKHSIDIVQFGGTVDTYGTPVVTDGAIVYVGPGGNVIQANVIRPQAATGCRPKTALDDRGVAVGTVCFSYARMTQALWTSALGGHEPYQIGPGWFATVEAWRDHLASAPIGVHLRRQPAPAGTAIYTASRGRITYRYTLVNAFPGLSGSIWPLVRVERLR